MDTVTPSPCNSVCRIEPRTGWCEGCARTLDEIAAWSGLDEAGRRAVVALLDARRRELERQRREAVR